MPRLKAVKNLVTPQFKIGDLESLAKEYDDVSKTIRVLEKQKKELSERIKLLTEKFGVKNDGGSFYADLGSFVTGKVARKSVSIDIDKAIPLLTNKGRDDLIHPVTTYKIDEAGLEAAVQSGDVTQEELESICDVKVSYSVSVKPKEELAEIETSTLAVASKKKKK